MSVFKLSYKLYYSLHLNGSLWELGVGLDSDVNLLAKWFDVIKGPRYQMSLKALCCCQICNRYNNNSLS